MRSLLMSLTVTATSQNQEPAPERPAGKDN